MSLRHVKNLNLDVHAEKKKVALVDASGNIKKTLGTVSLYMKAPNGPIRRLKFLVTEANEEAIMVSWSDLQRLSILHHNFPEVIKVDKVSKAEMNTYKDDP